ncbi:hypothetical protein [Streptomyces sp. NPDC002537]
MRSAIRLARVGSRTELAAALVMALSYPLLALSALLPAPSAFTAVCCASYGADHLLRRRGSYLINRLGKVAFGLTQRFLLRQMLLALLVARMGDLSTVHLLLGCLIPFHGLQALHNALTTLIRIRRKLPIATRNIDLAALRIPNAPPGFLLNHSRGKTAHLDLPLMAGVLLASTTGAGGYATAGAVVTVGAALICTAALLPWLRPDRLPPGPKDVLAEIDAWLGDQRPRTVLYFSGSKDSAYQVNMWLETMAHQHSRPLVLLRERAVLDRLAPTPIPVICVPGAVHLMQMDLSSIRVALYPANVGRNIHLLRVPTMKHVFIGHGDSDKSASVNPFSKVYDEVWTAGPAGRERYRLAAVGVRDADIVEVGRPQLASVQPWDGAPRDRLPTVLYAPTWEGWDDRPGNTSLMVAGENIMRRLLEAPRPVRVLYRPHPFAGTRDPQAEAAHLRITAMIEEAAARRAADPAWAACGEAGRAEARAELTFLTTCLETVTDIAGRTRDEAEASRVSGEGRVRADTVARLQKLWNETYWRAVGDWQHHVVTADGPQLYDCFNVADGLVADVSSVVSDFTASGKPYAVTDSAGLGPDLFRLQNTAARAATILTPEAAQIEELLDAITLDDRDPLAADRQELKEYLLGSGRPGSLDRFDAAIRRLVAVSESRNRAAVLTPRS